jgi:hypothetical protein
MFWHSTLWAAPHSARPARVNPGWMHAPAGWHRDGTPCQVG